MRFYGQESKESSQRTDVLLETCSAQAFTGFGDVGFQVRGLDLLQRDPLFFQVLEKALRRIPVVRNSGRGESPYFAQIVPILFDQSRGGRGCWGWSVSYDQTVRGQISFQCSHGFGTIGTGVAKSPPTILENRASQIGDLFDPTASKASIHMRQLADKILARVSRVAMGDQPIVKAIGDRPQQRHGPKPEVSLGKERM